MGAVALRVVNWTQGLVVVVVVVVGYSSSSEGPRRLMANGEWRMANGEWRMALVG